MTLFKLMDLFGVKPLEISLHSMCAEKFYWISPILEDNRRHP